MSRRRQAWNVASGLERLEGRELPSAALYLAAARLRIAASQRLSAAADVAPGTLIPTPGEQKRLQFVAKFTGDYITGPPQLVGESVRIQFIARRGGSNQFLHGVSLVAVNLNADPTQPTTRATAAIYPQNTATTGSSLVMDLTADPATSNPNAQGLPRHYTWTVDGSSGGLYSNAVAVSPGTLDVVYIPRKARPGGFTSGGAILVFKGSVLTTGVGNIARANL